MPRLKATAIPGKLVIIIVAAVAVAVVELSEMGRGIFVEKKRSEVFSPQSS